LDKNFSFLNTFSDIDESTFTKLQEISTLIDVKAGKQLVKSGEACFHH
jgi:hypothetical protein